MSGIGRSPVTLEEFVRGRRCPLEHLLPALEAVAVEGSADVVVDALAFDSREVAPGALFFAVRGCVDDGSRYLAEAFARGARAAVVESDAMVPTGRATIVRVRDVRRAKARAAARFFGDPSRRVATVGITGTNGKTTTAWMLAAIAEAHAGTAGLIGTVEHRVGGRRFPARNTTPDPIEVQRLLATAADERAALVAMEVSSHALAQSRVEGVAFRAAVFTNLAPEHLDAHGTLEAYLDQKARLFDALQPGAFAVLNADDPRSVTLARRTRAIVVRYGLEKNAEVRVRCRRIDLDGASFDLEGRLGRVPGLSLRLPGRMNVQNAAAAAVTALLLGLPPDAVRQGLSLLKGVPGRLEPIDCGQDFRVLVDYAHTDHALAHVLATLRPLTRGRLIVVFGCGGDRDRGKRPRMGRTAARLGDRIYLTSDNPRSEDPEAIVRDILVGIEGRDRARVRVEVDRRLAIEQALREARGGDIVLVAGKGHETVQVRDGRSRPFDDREIVREVLWTLS